MQPSSLIFLVIVAVWAAYFLHYWMRRRELISTARTVDRFSHTMRVLAIRTDDVRPATSPDRTVSASRQVVPAASSRAALPLATSSPSVSLRARSGHRSQPAQRVERADGSFASADLTEGAIAMRPRRTLRGLVLLVGLLGTVAFTGLALFGAIRWVGLVVPMVMMLTGFLWLRSGIRSEARARAVARQAARGRAARRSAAPRTFDHETQAVEVEVGRAGEVAVVAQRDEVYDGHAVVAATAQPRRAARPAPADDDDVPDTWEPRAVPTPTYAIKARAQHRTPAALPSVEELTAFEDDVVPLRPRAATG